MKKKDIYKYLQANAISGDENEIAKLLLKTFKKNKVEFIKNDALGNMYFGNIDSKFKNSVVFNAHMDETGFVVSEINENGTIKFVNNGGFLYYWLINARVVLKTEHNKMYHGSIYYFQEANETIADLKKIETYYIDFAFTSREDAIKHGVKIGDTISFVNQTFDLANDCVLGKAVDNRISVAVLAENASEMTNLAHKNKYNVVFSFAVQEEIGIIGSRVIDSNINGDLYVNLDVSPVKSVASRNPKNLNYNYGRINQGVHIRVYDASYITKMHVRDYLLDLCKNNDIKHYSYVSAGGTDSFGLSLSNKGNVIIPITIGYHYAHGPSQIFDFKDVLEEEKILLALVKDLNPKKIAELKKIY